MELSQRDRRLVIILGIASAVIIPQIGTVPLRKLHRQHIQHAYGEMRAKGLSPRTIIQAHRVLREALQHAYEGDVIGRNLKADLNPDRIPFNVIR